MIPPIPPYVIMLLAVLVGICVVLIVTQSVLMTVMVTLTSSAMIWIALRAGVFDQMSCGYDYYYAVSAQYPISTNLCPGGTCNAEWADRATAKVASLRHAAERVTDTCVKAAMLRHASSIERDIDYARQQIVMQQRIEEALKQARAGQ